MSKLMLLVDGPGIVFVFANMVVENEVKNN
jgi:hypothetical protein